MRPDDISAAAWGYAGRYHHDRMYGYDASSRERTDIHNRRRQMAREFDAATKPLREYSEAAASELQLILKDELCDHSVGICWCSPTRRLEEYARTLSQFTPKAPA